MTLWRKITVEKFLRYFFLLLSIVAGLFLLINLNASIGIGEPGANIRGWVHYSQMPNQTDNLPMGNGQIQFYTMRQLQFAMVHFDSLSALFQGLPLSCMLCQLLSDLAILLVFYQMMQIFRSLDQGEIFRANNLARMRSIAYAVLAYAVLTFLTSYLLAIFIQGSGESFRGAYPAYSNERIILGVLVALIILALLKAFKLGTQLQQEQDLTI